MSDTKPEGHAWADRMTRTQWLLVAVLGLLGWIGGYTIETPVIAMTSAVVLLFALLSAWHTTRKG